MLKLELSSLRLPSPHSGSSPALPFTYWGYLQVHARGCSIFGKYLNAHLNLRYMAASIGTYIHTHFCNAVPLVWGSLRLAPINLHSGFHTPKYHTRTQLSAYNVGILYPPTVVTHCPPSVVVVYFHIATGKTCVIRGVSTIDQTNR